MIRNILTGLIVLLSFNLGIAQQYKNGLIDKTIAIVGDEMIQLSQIESEVQMLRFQQGLPADQKLRCQVLESMLESKLFLIQARLDSLSVNHENVEAQLEERIANVVSRIGGQKAAEEYFGKSLFALRQDWRPIIEEQNLVQEMQRSAASTYVELTPSQVKDFYNKTDKDSLPIISTQYKYSQISMYPDKTAAEMEIKERLLEYRKRILDGEKFSVLATLYSQDPGTAMKGGELGMSPKTLFEPEFADAAAALKVGQVSPIVETTYGFHIIQMIAKEGDMINVRHILLIPDYSTEVKQAVVTSLDSLRSSIVGDTISFENAAMIYSEDALSRTNGGMVADANTGSVLFEKDQLKPEDYVQLSELEEGEVSRAFESKDNEGRLGNLVYKLLRLDKVIPSHTATFEDDYDVLQSIANNNRAMQTMDEFIKDKQAVTYIVIDPLFENCDFARTGWLK